MRWVPAARWTVAALAAGLVACGAGPDSPVVAPPTGATDTTPPAAPTAAPTVHPPAGGCAEGAEVVAPQPGTLEPRPRPFEAYCVDADDRTLTVVWTSGVEPCYVLDRVEVRSEPDRVVVTLWEGAGAADVACIEIAVRKAVVVELPGPLDGRRVVDGSAT